MIIILIIIIIIIFHVGFGNFTFIGMDIKSIVFFFFFFFFVCLFFLFNETVPNKIDRVSL